MTKKQQYLETDVAKELRTYDEFDVTQPLPPEYQDPPGKFKWCKNGVIFDTERGKFVNATHATNSIKDPARRALITKHKEQQKLLAQQAAQRGMAKQLTGDSDAFLEAWGEIVGAQAGLATNTEDKTASASVRAAEFVGRAAGLLSDPRSKEASVSHDKMASIGRAFVEEMAARLGLTDDEDTTIIDGEFE